MLDHALDKGIVIDAWLKVSLAGIDLLTVEARVVVASIATYLGYAGDLSHADTVSWTRRPATRQDRSLESQLRRMREQLERRHFAPLTHRRVEDKLRNERHDAGARTIAAPPRA